MHETREDRATLGQLRRMLELAEEALAWREAPAEAPESENRPEPAREVKREPEAVRDVLAEIEARAAFGDIAPALVELRDYAERSPSASAFTLLASIERRESRLEAADAAAWEAERLAGAALARARCERARTLVDSGRTEEARTAFADAQRCDPQSGDALVGLGSLALHGGDAQEAGSRFRQALDLEKSSRTLAGLGLALIAMGRPRDSFDFLEQALDLEADCASAVYGIVQAAFQTGDLAPAERRVRAYVELHSGNLDMTFTLAGLREQLGDHDGAREMLERIELFDPSYQGLSELRRKLG